MREPVPFGKVMGALLVAAIAASILGGTILGLLFAREAVAALAAAPVVLLYALVFGFPLAFGHALLLGLPAYLWLERRYQLHWWNAMGAGAVIGALPALFWIGPASAWDAMIPLLILGASGAGGGLVFRLALRDLMRRP
ncbi:hypothetical protein J2W22_003905 [Sphingomonas kyeonggiensis]|uniref:hypothetical protein n=1 Tax=Sphingomonas kyeonggiensis TaxID=1268553 RepID=UPI00277F91EB|nr:hypothetical protein [Sphingomonas kyeonggiensis]MDQ0251817.1 hypothetical protein [Sphingomonas kyeonggiensis]